MGMFTILPPARKVLDSTDAFAALQELEGCKLLAVDTETTGLSRPRDRAIILAISDGVRRFAIWPAAIPYFRDLLEDPTIQLIFHNANFDSWMLYNVGINIYRRSPRNLYRAYDTMVMHAIVNDVMAHDLKSLTKWYLDIDMVPFKTVFNITVNKKLDLESLLLNPANVNVVANYASLDAYATYLLFLKLRDFLQEMNASDGMSLWDYYLQYEVPFTKVLWKMELKGVRIDNEGLLNTAPQLENEMLEIQKWFGKHMDELYVNPNSNAEMGKLFYSILERPVRATTAGGDPALTQKILEGWRRDGCEYADNLLRYRDLNKQLGTYVLNIYEKVHHDGRIHASFNQTGARTGRLSSSDPNLQNQPPFIREYYIAEEGHKLLAADYAQLEMRILAHNSGDPTICTAIREGLDIHCATASTMFGVPYEKVKSAKDKDDAGLPLNDTEKDLLKKRKAAKNIGFGLMYGQGARKLAGDLRIEVDEAKGLIRKFFNAFPAVTTYFRETIQEAKELGYCTTFLGRRRLLPGVNSYYQSDVAAAERKIKNTPIQGSAAEIAKLAMIKLWEDQYIADCGVDILIQVHDEIVFEVPEPVVYDMKFNKRVKQNMMHPLPFELAVPLETSSKHGDNWLVCK